MLALSLAIPRQPPVATGRTWTMIFNPCSFGTGVSWASPTPPSIQYHRVDDSQAQAVGEWATIVDAVDDSQIRIAQRRLLAALSQRPDPGDGFVDTMVAWENLSGAAEGDSLGASGGKEFAYPMGRRGAVVAGRPPEPTSRPARLRRSGAAWRRDHPRR